MQVAGIVICVIYVIGMILLNPLFKVGCGMSVGLVSCPPMLKHGVNLTQKRKLPEL